MAHAYLPKKNCVADIHGSMKMPPPTITLDSLNLEAAERRICVTALEVAGSIVDAAKILGITRHALKRRIIKHKIAWPPPHKSVQVIEAAPTEEG